MLKSPNSLATPTRTEKGRAISILLSALKDCTRSRSLKAGTELHLEAAAAGLDTNRFLAASLINMYAKCGSMTSAQAVFNKLTARDVVCWNSLLTGYVDTGQNHKALEVFHTMEKAGCSPDDRTFLAALSACSKLAAAEEKVTRPPGWRNKWLVRGEAIFSLAAKSGCSTVYVESSVVDMYARCGRMAEARRVFDCMAERNVVVWTTLLQGYVSSGESELAVKLFDDFCCDSTPDSRLYVVALSACGSLAGEEGRGSKEHIFSKGREIHARAALDGCCNTFVENTLVNFYSKLNRMDLAAEVFDRMAKRDVVSWTALVTGYVDNGENELALEKLSEMESAGVSKNSLTYVAALAACGNLLALENGRLFHEQIRRSELEHNILVANSLVDFYGRCGDMELAREVFDSIPEKSVVSWTSLLGGYSLQGDTRNVFRTFERMREQGVAPNEVTLACVLAACSHAGLTSKGREYVEAMKPRYGVTPNRIHYSCMVDLLGRGNHVEEALAVVRSMPFKANGVMWRSLLGACLKWKNVRVGRVAYEALLELDERDGGALVLMAKICEECGMGEEFQDVVKSGSLLCNKRNGSCWWTDETGKVHKFHQYS